MEGASDTRTLRGIAVSYTLSPKCPRTSSITSCVSRAWLLTIVKTMPFSSSAGFTEARIRSIEPVMRARPSIARNSAWIGMRTPSHATSELVMTMPSDGGQSSMM